MNREKVIDTIHKLLNLSEGTNSPAEAEAAAAKAQQLLLKYNLEMADVNAHIDQEEKLVGQEITETGERKNESNWILKLYRMVGAYNFCQVLRLTDLKAENPYGAKITIIGRKGNVEVLMYTVEWLIPRIRDLAHQEWLKYDGVEKKGRFKRGFLIGCVGGIGTKLRRESEAAQAQDTNVHALVVDRSYEIGYFIATHYRMQKTRRRSLSSWEGRQAGNRAGQDMSIRRGVTGDNKFGGYLE